MMLPPILLTLIWLITRRRTWHLIERLMTGQPVAFHHDGTECRDRWCPQRRHW